MGNFITQTRTYKVMNWELFLTAIILIGTLINWYINRKEKKDTYKTLNEYNKLKIQITENWGKHNYLQAINIGKIREVMTKLVVENKANYVHFCVTKNGGDHITARKDYTVTVLYEEHNSGKPPLKQYWQNVEAMDQLKDIYRIAVVEDYYYQTNYKELMDDGSFKKHIDPQNGSDIAAFEIGKIDKEHYFLTFQFSHAGGVQTDVDKGNIKNICQQFKYLLNESELMRKDIMLQEKKLDMIETELIKLKMI